MTLSDGDLSDASYFWGADLRGALLTHADLRGAQLNGADLRGALLVSVDLRGASLLGADLRGALLEGQHVYQGGRNSTTTATVSELGARRARNPTTYSVGQV